MSKAYEALKVALELYREESARRPSRAFSIVVTMLEQALSYAWLFIESK